MLSFNNLSVNYGEKAILQDLTGEIKAGQCVGLIGENGAGKSSILLADCCNRSISVIRFERMDLMNQRGRDWDWTRLGL